MQQIFILEKFILRNVQENHAELFEFLFALNSEIWSILYKTRDSSSGVLRLKWWFDIFDKNELKKIEDADENKKKISKFAKSLTQNQLQQLSKYIESFEPLASRRQVSDIDLEFLRNNSDSLENFLCNFIEDPKPLSKALSCLYLVDNLDLILSSGWDIIGDEENFDKKIKEAISAALNSDIISNDRMGNIGANFAAKATRYILRSFGCKNFSPKSPPELNPGVTKIRLSIMSILG